MHIAVDGLGLVRPRAGVGVYTSEILRAMAVDRPDCRLTVFTSIEPSEPGPPTISYCVTSDVHR